MTPATQQLQGGSEATEDAERAVLLLQHDEPNLTEGLLSIEMEDLMPKEAKRRLAAGNVSEPVPEHWDMQEAVFVL